MFVSPFRLSRALIILAFALFPSLVHADFSGCGPAGSFQKPIGVASLCIHHDITVFAGHSGRACPDDPTKPPQHDPLPDLTKDEGICYVCDPVVQNGVCDNWVTVPDFCSTTSGDPPVTTTYECGSHQECPSGLHQHIGRNCHQKGACKYILDDALYGADSWGYAKNVECGGDACVPNLGLIVSKEKSKTYMWDPVPPVCVRGGYAGYASLGSDFIFDNDIRALIASGSGSTDTTLTYDMTDADNNPSTPIEVYPGVWTNRDVRAKGVCGDGESGCDEASSVPVFSAPLHNRQSTFTHSPAFSDIAKNQGGGECPSSTSKMIGINRTCNFQIQSKKISQAIADNPKWYFNVLSSADQEFLSGAAANPPAGTSAAFGSTIKHLRELSMSGSTSLSTFLSLDPPKHDLLYNFVTGSCIYTPRFAPGAIVPMIDRIKPTIDISAQIGAGMDAPDVLLQQEGTDTAGVPLKNDTGSFLAGSGTIEFEITDSGSSTFTSPDVWSGIGGGWTSSFSSLGVGIGFNGISGTKMFSVTVCRTKTHTGMVLNPDCSGDPTHIVYSTGGILDGSYNATGTGIIPHLIQGKVDLSDATPDGIRVIGEYQVYIAVRDEAGNTNTGTATFDIYPAGIDPDKTRLDKYNDPTDETNTHTLYTVIGKNMPIAGGANADSYARYANAIDSHIYKLSLFDVYANPVYGWNLYDFGLSETGIYLDEIAQTGPRALFSSTGAAFSNTPETVITNDLGAVKFALISYTPGEFPEQLDFGYKLWDRFRAEVGDVIPTTFPENYNTGSFHHIFTGAIELPTTDRIDLGTSNDVRLGLYTTTTTRNKSLTGLTISNFLETLISRSPADFLVTATGTYDPNISFIPWYPNPSYLFVTGVFTPEQVGSFFLDSLNVAAWPYITLTFSGQTARYAITDSETNYGSGVIYGGGFLNKIYVEGNKRTTGKEGYVDITSSIGSTNSADVRNTIHKNVGILLRNRTSTGIVNRVKYVKGDITTSTLSTDIDNWDTVIIKGGDLTIDNDFNTADSLENVKHKGIIVMTDDVTGSGGFIYIKPTVHFVGAILFADESVFSETDAACIAPVCNNNGIKDNSEAGVDCGGGGCGACVSIPTSILNGACGSDNTKTIDTIPTNVCISGTLRKALSAPSNGRYDWNCDGINGGIDASCVACSSGYNWNNITGTCVIPSSSCIPDGSCNASAPACGVTTYGTDNCGGSCSKIGGACTIQEGWVNVLDPTAGIQNNITGGPWSPPAGAPTSIPCYINNLRNGFSDSYAGNGTLYLSSWGFWTLTLPFGTGCSTAVPNNGYCSVNGIKIILWDPNSGCG